MWRWTTRFHRDDKDTFKILTEDVRRELWRNAVIALTFSKIQLEATESTTFCRILQTGERRYVYSSETLSNSTLNCCKTLTIVPTGCYRPAFGPEFWKVCNNVARNFHSAHFRLNRLKEDEEQPGWFLKKTWETFKEYYSRNFCCISSFQNWRNDQHNIRADM